MKPLLIIPLFYQLLTAYQSQATATLTVIPIPTPTSTPRAEIIVKENPAFAAQNIGGVSFLTDKRTIAVIGDSMIETLQPNLPDLNTALNKYYPDTAFNLINLGYPAQNLEYVQKRLQEDLFPHKPDLVVIESFAYNNFGNSSNGINRHWLDLGALTTTIKKELPNTRIVLAATLAPNSVIFGNNFSSMEKIEKTKTIKLYLQNLVNFANSENFPLANAYQYSLDNNNEGLPDLIDSTDHIHPSPAGAQLFSDIIAKTIFDNKLL
ncbi:MAG TPA: SGNH/GDSL hydrolase family protein [Candidatus Woesebacteria bacterium]|nr:SGNH/GDSL hydrolase family protein [Candidatus Woesebacteria bacterium]HRS22725.1 SGNH/GDSL hydrolase family protein [Candidatus Woesebacteria bacterium]HRT40296.1 SGNH/GDSL hydrolase family protein [Candidatus Woesebacteria bacterium]